MSVVVTVILLLAGAVAHAAGEGSLTDAQKDMLRALARGEETPWPAVSPEQMDALHKKAAAYWDVMHQYMLPHGQVVDVYWKNYERDGIERYETIGDATCWTGHYLTMLALRYKAEREPAVLEKINKTLDIFDKLTVASGIDGYIVRYVGPEDDPAYREYYKVYGRGEDPDRPGLGKWAYRAAPPNETEIWLGNSSRDTYTGFVFGVASAWAHVDDPQVREKIRVMVTRVGERMIADDWYIVDSINGFRTRPVPWFKLAWMCAVATVAPEKFPQVAEEYKVAADAALAMGGDRTYPMTFGDYFANNLGFALGYSLYAMEQDPERKQKYADNIRQRYLAMKDHLNGYFAMMYLGVTGDESEVARATALGGIIDLPAPPKWMKKVSYDGLERLDGNSEHVKYALIPSERALNDFVWQRSPTRIYDSVDVPYEYAGLDVLLPYWMGRAYGIIDGGTSGKAAE